MSDILNVVKADLVNGLERAYDYDITIDPLQDLIKRYSGLKAWVETALKDIEEGEQI